MVFRGNGGGSSRHRQSMTGGGTLNANQLTVNEGVHKTVTKPYGGGTVNFNRDTNKIL